MNAAGKDQHAGRIACPNRVELGLERVAGFQTGGTLDLVNERVERAVAVMRRAKQPEPGMRLFGKPVLQDGGQSRLADARLATDQHDAAVASFGAPPIADQQLNLVVAADQRGR